VITPILTEEAQEEPYFNLTVAPSRKQVFQIEVRNNTDKAVTVSANIYTAVQEADAVAYIGQDNPADAGEKRLSEYIEGDREILLPAQKAYLFQYTVNMPAEGLKEPMAGALVFLLSPDDPQASAEAPPAVEMGMGQSEGAGPLKLSSSTLSQPEVIKEGIEKLLQETEQEAEFSYVVPVFLQAEEGVSSPELTLKDVSVTEDNNEVKAKIQNKTSIAANQVTIAATVRKKGKKQVFFEASQENIEIPAHFDYELSVPSKGIKIDAGEYTLQIKLTTASTQWQWERNFTITKEKSDAAIQSETDTQEEEVKSVRYDLLIIPVLLLLVGAVTVCILLQKKKRREEEAILSVMLDIKNQLK